ncbi:hypothetical protein BN59_03413 [Legionella massiliensis]|uniref:Uncharacterized protein n=1 Tax=Legionella massiliensis TaxID=1034943 RepID=A0A078L1K6_9GAMM|nr:adenylate/guanylate cyclase domain-containing protein [Legionella massiliensis]CDZ79096.1 hypothetical protein BN59_03413 [Legionella massiliensis]CEE14834.1 hypothetical protein BN1094_03413 [Legionella massiliensis]
MRYAILKLLLHLTNFIRLLVQLFILLMLIVFLSQFVADVSKYPILLQINKFAQMLIQPFVDLLKLLMPYKYKNIDLSSIILIIVSMFISSLLYRCKSKLMVAIRSLHNKKDYENWRTQATQVLSKEKVAEMDSKFAALSTDEIKPNDRKRILREFAMLKTQLDNMGQQLAFLAIDVADSTGMKKDEDKYLAAYDFDRYNEIVNECLRENGVVKFAMTPDGIMSCFRTVDNAVTAAQCLLDKLKTFNAEEKKIKRDFHIRCGINAGFVYLDDETPLEQVSDRVIDIAGHMQKYAKPDCINIAASAIEPLKVRSGFNETSDVIDEQKVYEWAGK